MKPETDIKTEPSGKAVSPPGDTLSQAPEPSLLKAMLGKLIDVSTRTIWRMDLADLIPRAVLIGNTKRWRSEGVLPWIEAGCSDRRRWDAMLAHRQVRVGRSDPLGPVPDREAGRPKALQN